MSCNHVAPSQRLSLTVLLVGLFAGGVGTAADAADHFVSSGTSTFNCSSVNPGDTVTLAAGNRGALRVSDCTGTAANPIIIRNDPTGSGPTVIRRNSDEQLNVDVPELYRFARHSHSATSTHRRDRIGEVTATLRVKC